MSDHDRLIAGFEADSSLLEPAQMSRRLDALDQLDVYFAETSEPFAENFSCSSIYRRARQTSRRLEAVNSEIYESIRSDIQQGSPQRELLHWLQTCASPQQTPRTALQYDHLDELISGVLKFREPQPTHRRRQPEEVFYQPTPARDILDFIRTSALSACDTLVDLGSGLGHVPLLASILTPAQSIGVELDPAYIESARLCARELRLATVSFIQQDATLADVSTGTVFYMYTPFTGSLLKTMLRNLRAESARRRIKICTLGPCTLELLKEPWLKAAAVPDCARVTCFHSTP